jgi:hypothetical protein
VPPGEELLKLMVVFWVSDVGLPACASADCKDNAGEQTLTLTLNAPLPNRKPVNASVCGAEVRPAEETVIVELSIVASVKKKLAVLALAAMLALVI